VDIGVQRKCKDVQPFSILMMQSLGPAAERIKVFSASELYKATGGFHSMCLIGEGGFGKVFHAMVNLTPVAIKVEPNAHASLSKLI
jgi:hypothetical protein